MCCKRGSFIGTEIVRLKTDFCSYSSLWNVQHQDSEHKILALKIVFGLLLSERPSTYYLLVQRISPNLYLFFSLVLNDTSSAWVHLQRTNIKDWISCLAWSLRKRPSQPFEKFTHDRVQGLQAWHPIITSFCCKGIANSNQKVFTDLLTWMSRHIDTNRTSIVGNDQSSSLP